MATLAELIAKYPIPIKASIVNIACGRCGYSKNILRNSANEYRCVCGHWIYHTGNTPTETCTNGIPFAQISLYNLMPTSNKTSCISTLDDAKPYTELLISLRAKLD